jgi:hypothetical protein
MKNYNIGVMGKKGSGKSHLVKHYILPKVKRYLVLDSLREYKEGVICGSIDDLKNYIFQCENGRMKGIFRPENDTDVEEFLALTRHVNTCFFILEEVDLIADSNRINDDLLYNIKYGRHYERSILWISRCPYEINRFLTRQTDLMITFKQTEPRDLDYLAKYSFNKDIATLGQYEYAYTGDEKILQDFVEKA